MSKVAKIARFVNRQVVHICQGGFPVAISKIIATFDLVRRVSQRSLGYICCKFSDLVEKQPLLFGLRLVYSLSIYVVKTLLGPYSIVHLRRFFRELVDLTQANLAYQADPDTPRLIGASKLLTSDLPKAIEIYQQARITESKYNALIEAGNSLVDSKAEDAAVLFQLAINDYPQQPAAYFSLANALYLQGKYLGAISGSYKSGLEMIQERATLKGLHLLDLKLIGEEWAANIGHLSILDVLVKLERLELLSQQKRIVFVRSKHIANPCYLNYWSQHLNVVYLYSQEHHALRICMEDIFEHLSCLQLKDGYTNLYSAWNLAEHVWQSQGHPPLLELSSSHEERGWAVLEKLGVPRGAWFVGLHVREGDKRLSRSNSNADINTYMKAAQTIVERGGWVIRMGHLGMTSLPELPGIIDYANSEFKSDWMDVFLWATGRFLVGTASGPLTVPPTFGKPVLYTNCPAIGINPKLQNSLMLPKLYWSNSDRRWFTFREILDRPLGWTVSRVFGSIDCKIVDNSPEEIDTAVLEMLDITSQAPEYKLPLSDRQVKFNTLRGEYADTGQCAIANTFIHKYAGLLD